MTHLDELYTEAEARELVGWTVIAKITYNVVPAGTAGQIVEVYPDSAGGFGVTVQWDYTGITGQRLREGFNQEEMNDWLIKDVLDTRQQRLAFYARYDDYLHRIAQVCREGGTMEDVKQLVDTALITDDCPVCVHPWGYCICREDR